MTGDEVVGAVDDANGMLDSAEFHWFVAELCPLCNRQHKEPHKQLPVLQSYCRVHQLTSSHGRARVHNAIHVVVTSLKAREHV